jgi:hypothetical protein
MKSPVAHWGSREWRKNIDDLVPDPAHPQAFPSKYPMDLMGRIRVKLCTEDGNLVAYGFRGQRVALPAKSVGFVITVSAFRTGRCITHGRALLVLDDNDRILLRRRCPSSASRRPTRRSAAAPCRWTRPTRSIPRNRRPSSTCGLTLPLRRPSSRSPARPGTARRRRT